jgi:hypothetical protein
MATGERTISNGSWSFAGGRYSEAHGTGSFAFGISDTASGSGTVAMGMHNKASGSYSTALGLGTKASGTFATALGKDTWASGDKSTAFGDGTIASGNYSTAMGYQTTASELFSMAMGSDAIASGDRSLAIGHSTAASGDGSLAIGHYVSAETSYAMVLGTGLYELDPLVNNIENSLVVGFEDTIATLFVGGPNQRVGIRTTSPSTALQVNGTVTASAFIGDGSGLTGIAGDNLGDHTATQNVVMDGHWLSGDGGSEGLLVDNSGDAAFTGDVGIGTVAPEVPLHIQGGTDASLAGGGFLVMGQTNSTNLVMDSNEIMARNNGGTAYIHINRDGGDVIFNENGGNVGVGTASPARKLHVSDILRLEPRAAYPSSPSDGDICLVGSVGSRHIYCYLNGAWSQLD